MSGVEPQPPQLLSRRKLLLRCAILLGLTAVIALLCSLVGVVDLSFPVWKARMVRLLSGALVGAGLAVGGMGLQGILRNPLAEPYILGVSSGAGVGVLIGMGLADAMGLPDWMTVSVLGFVGALMTCAVVYGIAQRRGHLDPYVLLLSGVIVNAFNGAVMLTIYLFVKPYIISAFMHWVIGTFAHRPPFSVLPLSAVCIIGGWTVLFLRGSAFNAMGLGDDVARSTGVPVHWVRIETFLVVGLMTASCVALAGPIGFLGLIVPHICRLIVGPDHRSLALFSGFIGAMFLMTADTLCRTADRWINIGEIPVGIVTAFCGAPFFIFLLRRRWGGERT